MKDHPLFFTETMARMCAAQGYFEKSVEIYRTLLKNNPENEKLRQALAEVQQKLPGPDQASINESGSPDRLESLVGRWVGLMVENDLKHKFNDLRKKIKTGQSSAE